MALQVYNTLHRRKELFTPLHEGYVGIYVCGPTVYGHSHLGHAKSYVSFDVIVRHLRSIGYRVLYVQNITDVGHLTDDADQGEDKLDRQARIDRIHPMQLAETYTRSYFEDMDALNVRRPDIVPRASGHITEQIAIIQALVAKGMAYAANGSVYFDVGTFPAYGKLSGRTVEELNAGARVEIKEEKKHPADFALWKKAEPGHIMRWPSPWGEGFPGWHIECSAMSMKYLGEGFDIHGGGLENQFPHHECEIAQSEASTGKPFVRYWLHNNMVTVDGKKMGKSLGNFLTLKDAFAKWEPQVVRFFILQSHYRSTLDFSDAAVDGARAGYEKLANTLRNLREKIAGAVVTGEETGIDLARRTAEFREAMDDDFNTPQAIAVLFDLARELNGAFATEKNFSRKALEAVDAWYVQHAGAVLGISTGAAAGRGDGSGSLEGPLVELLIAIRGEIRAQKLWALSDRVRDGLARIGIGLEDKKTGTTWKRTS
ncbi:MAG TPA: cysteine--tRNA ligase [Bacteroidota bacterium]|nr:cysteine--tRNA ligase [Bacteroidota bacterium]